MRPKSAEKNGIKQHYVYFPHCKKNIIIKQPTKDFYGTCHGITSIAGRMFA